jgi:twitching motility two-component system response regulator PilG
MSPREVRIVGIILARVQSTRFQYTLAASDDAQACGIALVDPLGKDCDAELARLRARHPGIIAVFISDGVLKERNGYRVSRRSLWSNLVSTLDEIVVAEHSTSAAAISHKPLRPAPTNAAQAETGTPAPANIRALVLDDSVTVRNQIDAALHALGIAADGAASWSEACERLERNRYDLMFLDVIMPGIDGYEVCRRVRRHPATRKLPVIMLTSRSSTFDRARGALAGCDLYLVKPIDLPAFHQAVNRVVARVCRNDLAQARSRGFVPIGQWPGTAIPQ